jgi:hypothetical protein
MPPRRQPFRIAGLSRLFDALSVGVTIDEVRVGEPNDHASGTTWH